MSLTPFDAAKLRTRAAASFLIWRRFADLARPWAETFWQTEVSTGYERLRGVPRLEPLVHHLARMPKKEAEDCVARLLAEQYEGHTPGKHRDRAQHLATKLCSDIELAPDASLAPKLRNEYRKRLRAALGGLGEEEPQREPGSYHYLHSTDDEYFYETHLYLTRGGADVDHWVRARDGCSVVAQESILRIIGVYNGCWIPRSEAETHSLPIKIRDLTALFLEVAPQLLTKIDVDATLDRGLLVSRE